MEEGQRRWSYSRFERKIFPEWLFHPGNEEYRRVAVIAYPAVFIAVVALITLGGLALARHEWILGLVDLSFALFLAGLILYNRGSKVRSDFINVFGVAALGVFCFYLLFFSGVNRPTYVWSYIFPLVAFPILGLRRGLIALILFLAPSCFLLVLDPAILSITSHPSELTFLFIPSILIVSGISYLNEKNRELYQQRLSASNIALQRSKEDIERQVRQRTAELARSEANYRFLTERMTDIVWTVDLNLNTTYVSPSITKVLGFSPEEYANLPLRERVTPETFHNAMAIWAAELEREKQPGEKGERNLQVELEFLHKNGSTVWMEGVMNAIRDDEGHLVGIHGVSRDVSERRRSEKTLKESEKKYRHLVENAADAITIIQDGLLRFVNPALCKMSGYEPHELIHKHFTNFIHPDDRSRIMEDYQRLMAAENPRSYYEFRGIAKGSEERSFEVKPTTIDWQDRPAILALVRDITEQKRVEEVRQNLEEHLHRVEKMEALGTLAGGVAHDMNNILGVLTGYSELLREEIQEENPMRNYVDKILTFSEKGAAIIQDLLTMTRSGVVSSDVVNINTIVNDFLKSPLFDKIHAYHPQVEFTKELSADLLNIKGSAVHLEKTVMNLISNATEAIAGGGTVTIKTENRYLDTSVLGYEQIQEGDYAVLSITDTGVGIAGDDIKKIFEPFYTKKKMGRSGTGLGLAIVWGTIKDHEGYIDIKSAAGEGSAFTLFFPATREEFPGMRKKIPIDKYLGKGETILVIDDVSEQREIATGMLTRLGYRVQALSGGEDAVTHLKTNHADLVVLDMIMEPGIDGLETYRRILEIKSKQKAIIVSGFAETDRVKEAQKFGAGAYVRKPYLMDKIGLAVREELDGRQPSESTQY